MSVTILLFLLLHLLPTPWSGAQDLFCGQLQVHKQKWLSKSAITMASQKTADLKECIGLCCSIAHCNAVTFIGFLADKRTGGAEGNSSSANCLLFNCAQDCGVVEQTVAREGVLTVLITISNNTDLPTPMASTPPQFLPPPSTPPNQDQQDEDDSNRTLNKLSNPNSTSPSAAIGRVLPIGDDIPQEEDGNTEPSSPPDDSSFPVRVGDLAPVWAVGLAVVVGVVCGGLSLALIGAYLCYKRHRTRMRTTEINTIKAPTLHAFNPQT